MKLLCRYLRVCSSFLCLLLALSGCSQDGGDSPAEVTANLTRPLEEALVERVKGKWRAMEVQDYSAVYEYTTPNYRRVFSKSMYLNKFGYDVHWELTGVDVLYYDARAAVASVAVRVMSESTKQTTLASNIGPMADTVHEKWYYIDGEWWNSVK